MMKIIWFKRAGWLYVPVHGMGLVITLTAIIFLVPSLMTIVKHGADLVQMFIYISCTAFWWKWIAEKTSTQ